MNTSKEYAAMASDPKQGTVPGQSRSWSIRWKIRMAFLLSTLAAGCIIVFIVYVFQRKAVIKESYNKMLLLQNTKAEHIEDYFSNLNNQIKLFSADRQTIEALNMLGESFQNIESDNYGTPAVTDLGKMTTLLEGFYTSEIIPRLEMSGDNKANLQALLPADSKQRIMQYLYLAGNVKTLAMKGTLNKADDGSIYSSLHAQYHPEFLKFAQQAGIADIFLIDYKSGNVVYSIRKNIDFATNLFDGPFRNSALALAFKTAIAQSVQGTVSYIDESKYLPALLKPMMFISTPVYTGGQMAGVVVFALDTQPLDQLLALDKDGLSSGRSLKTIIIGKDLFYRNNDPEFVSDQAGYMKRLKRNSYMGGTSTEVEKLSTTAMIQKVDPIAFSGVQNRKTGISAYSSETGENVLCTYRPLAIDKLNWTLVTQINKSEVLAAITRITVIIVLIALLITGILFYVVSLFSNVISEQLISLRNNLMSLANGHQVQIADTNSGDEIGQSKEALARLAKRITEGSMFVSEVGRGNTGLDFSAVSDEDQFGIALNSLKQNLVLKREEEEKRKREDEIRNWTAHGIAMFNDILRSDNNNLDNLSINIIRNIIQYLSANQGGLFLIEEEEDSKYLNLVASYAYDRQKFLKKKINIGEGLAGNCVLEKKTVLLNKIPNNYLEISSGLGGSKPGCLMIVPLKKDEDVLGVLEIASFNDFKTHEVEFVEKVAESIASALITVRLHLQTSQFLERFQQQAEEMKAQDEELRQNIEELQATHEQMERLKQEENERNQKMIKEIDDYRKLLISVLNEVPEKIFLKDDQGRFIIANKQVADNYNRTVDEILGKSDFDFYPREEATEYFLHEQNIIKSGKTEAFEEGDPSKYDSLIVRSTKKPFYIEHLGITGLFGVQVDISDLKRKEFEAVRLAEEISKKQQEIEAASHELKKEKALLDALLNNVPEHIYFKDKESRFIRFSKSMLELFGLKNPEELIGKSDFDFFSREHSMPAFEGEQNIIKTGKAIIDLEEKNVLTDGTASWVNTTKMPLVDDNGEIIGTFGISKDITRIKKLQQDAVEIAEELKAQEEELRQNMEEMHATQEDMKRQLEENERMREALGKEKALMDGLMDNVPDHIYFKDKQSRFIRFSKSMLKLFGLKKPEELIGKSDFDFFSEEHATPAFNDEQNIIKTGKAIIDLEEKEVLTDGTISWVNTTKMPLRDTRGEIIGTFGISKNISKLKNLELKALEMMKVIDGNRKLLIDILDKVPAKVFLKDENGVFVVVNSAVASVYDKTPDQIIGTTDYDNHPNEDVDSWRKQEIEIMQEGTKVYVHSETDSKGITRHLRTIKMPLKIATTGHTGLLGIQFDITDMTVMEKKLEEVNKEIEALTKKGRRN